MAATDPPQQLPAEEEDYNSSSDEDFNPDAPTAVSDADSSSDEDATITQPTSRPKPKAKRKPPTTDEDADADFGNSGDEATIASGQRKRKRRDKSGGVKGDDNEEESGVEGGLIKTRAQRRAEAVERKPLVKASEGAVDVDKLWAEMASGDRKAQNGTTTQAGVATPMTQAPPSAVASPFSEAGTNHPEAASKPTSSTPNGEATITIKRTYEFAGQTLAEERTVPASSAEARLYLQQQAANSISTTTPSSSNTPSSTSTTTNPSQAQAHPTNGKPPLRRPIKKRASMFGADDPSASFDGSGSGSGSAGKTAKGPKVKLTTLEKSKLDWAQHVDEEGLTEELDEASRAKGTYLGRMDFLGRMEGKREDDLKRGRGSGLGK